MYLTIQGLVLRVTDYNDRDALLTVLTKNYGKLTVKARGLRRKNSPLIAPCQLLSYGEFTLFEYKGQYTINEAHSLELFQNLRRDLTKLTLGTYFAQVAEVISQEDLPNPELLSLVLNCLHALSKLQEPMAKVDQLAEQLVLIKLFQLRSRLFVYKRTGVDMGTVDIHCIERNAGDRLHILAQFIKHCLLHTDMINR